MSKPKRCDYCKEPCVGMIFVVVDGHCLCATCVDRDKPPFIPMYVRLQQREVVLEFE